VTAAVLIVQYGIISHVSGFSRRCFFVRQQLGMTPLIWHISRVSDFMKLQMWFSKLAALRQLAEASSTVS
jgi:hypothetical protein